MKNLLLKYKSEYINGFPEIFSLIRRIIKESFLREAVGGFGYNKISLNLNTLINYRNDEIDLK